MKYDKNNSKKSRKLKSKKNTKKTRARVHLDKYKQKGGGKFVIDISEDRQHIYVTFTRTSRINYLYKINLTEKTYEIYIPEDGYAVHPRPLDAATRDLRKIISIVINEPQIYNIFVENDIDPSFPMKKSEVSPDSRKSSTTSSSRKSSSSSSSRKSSTPSLSSDESHSPNPDPLSKPLTRSRLNSALTFSRAIGENGNNPKNN